MLYPNTKTLIDTLENLDEFDDQFKQIQIKNRDVATGAPLPGDGVFSAVFRAIDKKSDAPVAIKFFDPDSDAPDDFRFNLFRREATLLEDIRTDDRCLRLIKGLSHFPLTQNQDDGKPSLSINCHFFITEWLDESVTPYFYTDRTYSAEEKLRVFREIILATQALHRAGIFHRDLKPENLRVAPRSNQDTVVAIDLGTGVRADLEKAGHEGNYQAQVGDRRYSPIESRCGLSGMRELGSDTDFYSLGCLLYELFSDDLFLAAQSRDQGFCNCFVALMAHMSLPRVSQLSLREKLLEWNIVIDKVKRQVTYPELDAKFDYIPPVLNQPVNRIIRNLTKVDYRDRWQSFEYLIRQTDSALRAIVNERLYKRRLVEKRTRRENRKRKAKMRDQKAQSRAITNLGDLDDRHGK